MLPRLRSFAERAGRRPSRAEFWLAIKASLLCSVVFVFAALATRAIGPALDRNAIAVATIVVGVAVFVCVLEEERDKPPPPAPAAGPEVSPGKVGPSRAKPDPRSSSAGPGVFLVQSPIETRPP